MVRHASDEIVFGWSSTEGLFIEISLGFINMIVAGHNKYLDRYLLSVTKKKGLGNIGNPHPLTK